MHGVDTADQYLAYYPFIRKTVKWPKKIFFCLLQCCLFNSYVIFSKNNPNSSKSFLDFMSDNTQNLIHQMLYYHRHHHLTSRKARVQHLYLLQKKVPQKMTPLSGLMENWRITNWSIIHPQKLIKRQHENVECVCEKISRKKLRFLCSVWCSSASRRLLYTISHAETLLKVCSKFQVFISYNFRVIIFLLKVWKKELWAL